MRELQEGEAYAVVDAMEHNFTKLETKELKVAEELARIKKLMFPNSGYRLAIVKLTIVEVEGE